ncbi:uncharacterized protein LOC127736627 isoform X2 [Mytilus californianus]|uniref:uncharacterized protein LOC127736627 isoform X2 n=1 Tax=Mytilus californianus TaxID=6549 RepID=UPI0022455AC1|nr:uncharacterized protein LOC127736627 isoform X2 [Mytilus californianus]
MASSLNNDVSMDASPTDENYKPNTVSLRGNREQHLPQANGENHSSEAAESAILNEYLAIDQSNNPSGPSSFAEYLERSSDTSVVGDCYPSRETPSEEGTSHQRQTSTRTEDEDDKIHRFFLELTASCGLKWTTFLAELGYNPKELFHLSVEKMDNHFRHYLAFWLETVTSLGQNPITYLYNALSLERHHELVDKFKDQFNIKYSPCSPPRHEFVLLKENLLKIPSQKGGTITSLNRKEEIMHVEKEIWSNLTDNELEQIKAYLHNTKKEKFGKRVLQEIKTSLDLFRKLHETCLVNEDSFEFLIKILKFVGRNDLIQKIMALETPYCRFEKDTANVKTNPSSCYNSYSDKKNTMNQQFKQECKHEESFVSKFVHSTKIIEHSISAKTKELWQTDCEAKELTTKYESCRQKIQKCVEERMQVEAQIKKLQSHANALQSTETSLGSDLSSLESDRKAVKKLHQKQTSELDLFKDTLEKENQLYEEELEQHRKQTLEKENKLQLQQKKNELEHRKQTLEKENNKIQLQQKEELEKNRMWPEKQIPRYSPVENDGPFENEDKPAKTLSRYESHISRDGNAQQEEEGAQIIPQCASSKEARARPLPHEVSVEPMILIMAAEENNNDLESFKADVLLAVPQSVTRSNIHEIVIESNITNVFLNRTDNQIQKAVLLFILVSEGFAKRCWPDISKMKKLTDALYDQQPLVVPVIIKATVKPPMGLNSAHSLCFYRRDLYYKEALSKLLGQFKE